MNGPPRPLPGDPIDRVTAQLRHLQPVPDPVWPTFRAVDVRRWVHRMYRFLHIEPRE